MKLTDPIFTDNDKAREHLEALLWPQGPYCPRCGEVGNIKKLVGKAQRPGLYQCNPCHRSFTVTVNTVMERSHIALTAWVAAFHLYATSKKGFSAHQLHRNLGITYKSAWFLAHRVREAMGDDNSEPMGGEGKTVEMDEAYLGGLEKNKHRNKRKHAGGGGKGKEAVFSLVERGGSVRSFHVDTVNAETLRPILKANVRQDTALMSDESVTGRQLGPDFKSHEVVNHSKGEYVRGEAHSNTVENFFSVFKRGMKGIYQHCGEQHLHRYLKEFDFRYSNRVALGVDDLMRTMRLIKGAQGKRLTYNQSRSAGAA